MFYSFLLLKCFYKVMVGGCALTKLKLAFYILNANVVVKT